MISQLIKSPYTQINNYTNKQFKKTNDKRR